MALGLKLEVTAKGKGFDGKRFNRLLTPKEDTKQLVEEFIDYHIVVAKEVVREEVLKGTFDPTYRRAVDGVLDNPEEVVKFLGKIEYFTRLEIAPIILEIYKKLLTLSPVDSGSYMNRHYVFFDGKVVAKNMQQLFRWTNTELNQLEVVGKEIKFINVSAYARKLETAGTTSKGSKSRGRKLKKPRKYWGENVTKTRPPNGVYWKVKNSMKGKYKQISTGKFLFELTPGSKMGLSNLAKTAGAKSTNFITPKYKGLPYVYPTIVIQFSGRGIKGKVQ